MSTIKNYEVNGATFQLFGDTWENSRNWGHIAILYRNGNELSRHKVTYYNRTWEAWQYQSAMLGAVSEAINSEEDVIIDDYKYNNNIKRLSGEKKQALLDNNKNNNNSYLSQLYNLLEQVRGR